MNIVQENKKNNKNSFSEEFKKNICIEVKKLIDTGIGIIKAEEKISKKNNISIEVIQKWDRKFRIFSSEKRVFTTELKQSICQEVKDNINIGFGKTISVKKVAEKYGIGERVIKHWDESFRIFSSNVDKNRNNQDRKNICIEVKSLIDSGIKTNKAINKISKKYKITSDTIRHWDKDFRIFSSKLKNWTEKEKIEICNRVKLYMESCDCSAKQAMQSLSMIDKNFPPESYYARIYVINKELGEIFPVETKKSQSIYSDNEKRKILENINQGKKVSEVMKEYNLSQTTIYKWNRDLKVFKTKKEIMDEAVKKLETKIIQDSISNSNITLINNLISNFDNKK